MKNELISIVIPVYNVESYLHKCIDSILSQTYSNIEIILVDDGSTDSSGKICDDYLKKDSRVRVIHKTNGGLSEARNFGIEVCSGSFIGFVDSDDWIEKEMYASLYARLSATQTMMAVCGRYDCVGSKKYNGMCPSKNLYTDEEFLKKLFQAKEVDVSACDKLYHKSLFDDIRYPVGEINEDAAVIYRIVQKAGMVSAVNERYYNYNHRESSITTVPFSEKRLVELKNGKKMMELVQEKYPHISNEAKGYYGKKVLSLWLAVPRNDDYKSLYQSLSQELAALKSDLCLIDKIKYVLIKCNLYFLIRKCVKKIQRKY